MLALAVLMGEATAAAALRRGLVILIVLNVVMLGLLLTDLRKALLPAQMGQIGVFVLGGGMMLPFCLLVAGDGSLLTLTALSLLLLGSLAMRFVIVRIPHEGRHTLTAASS